MDLKNKENVSLWNYFQFDERKKKPKTFFFFSLKVMMRILRTMIRGLGLILQLIMKQVCSVINKFCMDNSDAIMNEWVILRPYILRKDKIF